MAERLYLVDGHSLLFRAYHAVGYLSTSRGVPSHAVLILSTMLWKLIREESPQYLGVAWDAPGATFRDRLFEEYKATRASMPGDLAQQLPYVRRLFEALRTPVVEVAGFEADDVLGTLVALVADRDLDVVIVTGDKDLLQLVGPRVRVLSVVGRSGERVIYDAARVHERWGVAPAQIPDVLALMGDSIDNIPGVPGVGEKTAVKLLAQFGTVERLYDDLSLVPGKLRETLARSRTQAFLSRELATVSRRVPIELDLEAFRLREPDWPRLRALWMEMEFTRLLKELPIQALEVSGEPAERLGTAGEVREYLGRLPAGAPLALDWAGESRPPDPRSRGLGLFHPAAGPAWVPLDPDAARSVAAALGGGPELIVHDVKPLLEWLLGSDAPLPRAQDAAVASYLLNPARQSYPLEQLCVEAFGAGPPELGQALDEADLGGRLAARARWLWQYWSWAAGELDQLALRAIYDDIERPLVPVLARMERTGVRVDPERLEGFAKELERRLDGITREIYALAGGPFNIGSPKQLAQVLFERLKLPAGRRTKTGYSTDADVLTALALGHELPAKLLEHRTLSKLKSTYADTLPGLIHPATGRIHTTFNQLVAATGRLSCLPAGTLVDTQRGLIGIDQVRPGDLLRTAVGPREVLAFEATGPRPVIALELSNGIVLRSSPDHKLWSRGEWKKAGALALGESLSMSLRPGLFGGRVALGAGRPAADPSRGAPDLPREWSVDLAELVGYLVADGHVLRSPSKARGAILGLRFGRGEEDLLPHFASLVGKLFGTDPTPRATRAGPVLEGPAVDLLGLLFERLEAGGLPSPIRVPPSLFRAPEPVVAGFLRGAFAGAGPVGEVLRVRSASRSVLEAIHHLLTVFGIPSTVRARAFDPGGPAPSQEVVVLGDRLRTLFRDRIGFISKGVREGRGAARRSLPPVAEPRRIGPSVLELARPAGGGASRSLSDWTSRSARGRTRVPLLGEGGRGSSLGSLLVESPPLLGRARAGPSESYAVTVTGIHREPAVAMYEIMVDGGQYIANGIVVHNSSSPNLQNIPIRTGLGLRIRAAFIPEPGWRFVAADYSQIELRILAHLSGEESLVEAFRSGEDIHRRTAAEVLKVPPEVVGEEPRRIAKMINYAVIYGVSAFGLAQGARIPQDQAETYISEYYATHPKVRAFIDQTVAEGRERGYVTTCLGRRRYLPDLKSTNAVARNAAERMAINAPIQGSSADMIKLAMVRVDAALRARGLRSRMLLQVHDELVFECPADEVDPVERLARELMESAMPLSVPVRVDVKAGADWSEV